MFTLFSCDITIGITVIIAYSDVIMIMNTH